MKIISKDKQNKNNNVTSIISCIKAAKSDSSVSDGGASLNVPKLYTRVEFHNVLKLSFKK